MRIKSLGGTYQSDFLHKRIPPFKNSKEELIGLLRLRPFVIEFHHRRLKDEITHLKSIFILCVSVCTLVGHKYLLPKLDSFIVLPRRPH